MYVLSALSLSHASISSVQWHCCSLINCYRLYFFEPAKSDIAFVGSMRILSEGGSHGWVITKIVRFTIKLFRVTNCVFLSGGVLIVR